MESTENVKNIDIRKFDPLQFGKRLADFQSWQFRLADMATEVEASRLMVRNAATAADEVLAEH